MIKLDITDKPGTKRFLVRVTFQMMVNIQLVVTQTGKRVHSVGLSSFDDMTLIYDYEYMCTFTVANTVMAVFPINDANVFSDGRDDSDDSVSSDDGDCSVSSVFSNGSVSSDASVFSVATGCDYS